MKVEIDTHSGFCFGVTRAIQAAEKELQHGNLYCLGDIVHNGQEVNRLETLGLQTIDYDDLRTLPSHSRVLLRAHGEPPSTYWIAQQRAIEITDATCPVVKKLQDRIRACYEKHKNDEQQPPQIVIFGKTGHAEVIGLQGQTNNTAIVIESVDQKARIDFARPIYLFSQTTKSVEGFQALVQAIQNKLLQTEEAQQNPPIFEYHDTICRQVANRMPNIRKFASAHDLVFFVCGRKSSNGKILYHECKKVNENTHLIDQPEEIDQNLLEGVKSIGICGATSTPKWLMEECKNKILNN